MASSECSSGLDPNAAIKRFVNDPDWRFKTGVGAFLNGLALCLIYSGKFFLPLLPISLCIAAIVQGYILRVVRSEIQESNAPLPIWNDWLDLLISGLTWMAVFMGLIVVIIFLSLLICSIGISPKDFSFANAQFPVIACSAAGAIFLLLLVVSLLSPFLMVNFANQEKVSTALAILPVLKIFFKRPSEFLACWLLGSGLFWLAVLVPVCTLVGIFLMPLILFATSVVNATMLAQAGKTEGRLGNGSYF